MFTTDNSQYPHNSEKTSDDLRIKYNPEGSDLRELQHRLLKMLLYLRDACEKVGISYYIDGGTLLGAVRHGGFIPWDDDLDIVVDVSDIKKLKKYIINNPPSSSFFQDRDTEKNYFRGWPKLVDLYSSSTYHGHFLETRNQHVLLEHTGVSVDIFPYSDHVISWINKIIHRLYKLNQQYVLNRSKLLAKFFSFLLPLKTFGKSIRTFIF